MKNLPILSIVTWLPTIGAIIILALFKKGQEASIKKFATAWFGIAFVVSLALLKRRHLRTAALTCRRPLKAGRADLVRGALVSCPSHGECREQEAIQRRINVARHGLFNDVDAAASIVREVLGDKRRAKRLNSRFLNEPPAWIAL